MEKKQTQDPVAFSELEREEETWGGEVEKTGHSEQEGRDAEGAEQVLF